MHVRTSAFWTVTSKSCPVRYTGHVDQCTEMRGHRWFRRNCPDRQSAAPPMPGGAWVAALYQSDLEFVRPAAWLDDSVWFRRLRTAFPAGCVAEQFRGTVALSARMVPAPGLARVPVSGLRAVVSAARDSTVGVGPIVCTPRRHRLCPDRCGRLSLSTDTHLRHTVAGSNERGADSANRLSGASRRSAGL